VTAALAVLATLTLILMACGTVGMTVYRRRELERTADRQLDDTLADRLLGSLYAERVLVTLRTGESFGGILGDLDDKSLLLHSAEGFLEGARKVPVDGELFVPRADVLYIQKP